MPVPRDSRLTSRQHAVVRRFRVVATNQDPDLVLLDGEHLVDEAMRAGVAIDVLLTDGRAPGLAGRARAAGASVHEGNASVLEAASPVRSPSGVVALARWRTGTIAEALAPADACCLALAGVQDPGNVGSAIRAADALGATGVLALDGTADPRGWKTLRGAMGSSFHLPIAKGATLEAIAQAKAHGLAVVASVATGGVTIDRCDLRSPTMILVGSEGAGLTADVISQSDRRVTVPMRAGVDSLNVAVTAAIVLFEARRQRLSS